MFDLKEISDKIPWEEFLKKIPHTPFLQSFAWGEFQKKIGSEVYRSGVYEEDKLVGVCCAVKTKAKFNSFLYVPWGPVFESGGEGKGKEARDGVKLLLEELATIARKEKLDFVRLEPRVIRS